MSKSNKQKLNVAVIEPFQHFIPTGVGWIEGLQELGHSATGLPSGQYPIGQIQLEGADCVVFMGNPKVDSILRFKENNPTVKIAVVCFGYSPEFLQIKDCVDIWIEHVYKHDIVEQRFLENGLKLKLIPLAASPNLFYSYEYSKPKNYKRVYDISFVGQFGESGHGYRDQDAYLYPLMVRNLKGFYSGFNGFPYMAHDMLNEVYNTTAINLNFHYPNQKILSSDPMDRIDFNGRVFEIAMAGGFQLCDQPAVEEYFGPGIVYASKGNWVDMFEYYLHSDIARQELAHTAAINARLNHTWKNRMEDFINALYGEN